MSANSNLPSAESACKWLFRVFLNPSYPIPCVSATEGVLIGKQTSDEDGSHKQKVSVVVVYGIGHGNDGIEESGVELVGSSKNGGG